MAQSVPPSPHAPPNQRHDEKEKEMNEQDSKFVERWGKHRKLGRSHFVWHHGVMGWGTTSALTVIALFSIASPGLRMHPYSKLILFFAILFPLGGILFGLGVFALNEQRYRELTETESEPDSDRRWKGGGDRKGDGDR